jgi:hypothetical protein
VITVARILQGLVTGISLCNLVRLGESLRDEEYFYVSNRVFLSESDTLDNEIRWSEIRWW